MVEFIDVLGALTEEENIQHFITANGIKEVTTTDLKRAYIIPIGAKYETYTTRIKVKLTLL